MELTLPSEYASQICGNALFFVTNCLCCPYLVPFISTFLQYCAGLKPTLLVAGIRARTMPVNEINKNVNNIYTYRFYSPLVFVWKCSTVWKYDHFDIFCHAMFLMCGCSCTNWKSPWPKVQAYLIRKVIKHHLKIELTIIMTVLNTTARSKDKW